MKRIIHSRLVLSLALSLFCMAGPPSVVRAQPKTPVPTGGTVNLTVTTAAPAPAVSITLHERHGHVTPVKGNCTHTGGGLIDVATPTADSVIITMSGVVVANSLMQFDLEQTFEVSFDDPKVKKANLTVEGRVIGLLRGERKGCAEYSEACATIGCDPVGAVSVCVPPHQVCGKHDSLAVNDHDGPKTIPVIPGRYVLHQTFNISAHSGSCLCKRPSAEFAPDPALDPLWINYFEPFHGVKKDSFGFQVVLKVAPDTGASNGEKKEPAMALPPAQKKVDAIK
jgi:hypothetical protein